MLHKIHLRTAMLCLSAVVLAVGVSHALAEDCDAIPVAPDPGDNLGDGMVRPQPDEIPVLTTLLAQTHGVADAENPMDYLGFIQTVNDAVSIAAHDADTLATTFSVPKQDGSIVYVTIDQMAADGDTISLMGDVDGVSVTGRIERFDDEIIVTINPEVLGIDLKPMKATFFVRKHTVSLQADGIGAVSSIESQGSPPATTGAPAATSGTGTPISGADQIGGRLDVVAVDDYKVCACCGGSGACSKDDCWAQESCGTGGTCKWGPPPSGTSGPMMMGAATLLLACFLGNRLCSRDRFGRDSATEL